MKVLILGGDGYLGWPTALAFSKKGHEVFVVDNYLRRNLSRDLDIEPLFPTPNLLERVRLWKEVSGNEIHVRIGDCCDYGFLSEVFKDFRPEALIHYAEQPSAPYSMLNHEAASLTLTNNLQSTLNIRDRTHGAQRPISISPAGQCPISYHQNPGYRSPLVLHTDMGSPCY
jgi:UDP-sulfoquinovose synthase